MSGILFTIWPVLNYAVIGYICPKSENRFPLNAVQHIPFHKPTFTNEDLACIEKAFTSETWAMESVESKTFFRDYYPHGVSFFTNSCSSALEMAVRALDIGVGDEVIIPAFGYVAVANAVVNTGAKPVFADVCITNGNISVQSIETCISSRTKAVIAIHYAGNPFDIDAILKLCHSANIFLIEDAAQCLGSSYNNKPLGSFGHLACVSFDYMKNVSCGQGGLLIVNERTRIPKVQTIFDDGTNKFALLNGSQNYFEWVSKGNNYRINPIASHFLNGQLKFLSNITEDRLKNWNLYFELLTPLYTRKGISFPKTLSGHNGHIFYLITRSAEERTELRSFLREQGIFSEHHYTSLAQSAYGKQFAGASSDLLRNSETLCNQLLRLPLWYQMPEEDIRNVVDTIEAFYTR